MKSKKSEPLFHIVKRKSMPVKYQMLVRLLAIVAAIIVCAIVTVITTKMNPLSDRSMRSSKRLRIIKTWNPKKTNGAGGTYNG